MQRQFNTFALVAIFMGVFGLAGTAQAAGPQFACRASAARAVTFGTPPLATIEPVRANATATPCVNDQSAETLAPTTIGPITADAVRAYTTSIPGTTPAATADAIVTAPRIALGGLTIGIDALEAHASATCTSATTPPTLASSSKVVNLTINGNTIAIPGNSQPFVINASPLVKISLNEKTNPMPGVVVQRAAHITAAGNDVVVAEAVAGSVLGNPCAAAGTTPGGPNPCPPGSTYDSARNVCEIVTSSGRIIIIGLPFRGPSGGTVISLAEARRRFPHNPCVHGPGLPYVVVGTNHADHITGTNGPDRIILLGGNDAAEGGRGDDCIDGGSGSDTLSGALGRDRMYGDSGKDHLAGGSQTDLLYGGSGNDSISAGFGADRAFGGSGNDHINANQTGPRKRVNCGSGRDKVRIFLSERSGVHGCERIFVTRALPGRNH